MDIIKFLVLLSGIAWTITYIDSIRIGIKDKSFAMPFWALGLNLAWEVLHSILGYMEFGLNTQTIVNIVWALFDVGILYTYFKYGFKYFPKTRSKSDFMLWSILGLIVCFVMQYAFVLEYGALVGRAYSAYIQNLAMSILFIAMLVKRNSTEGQTMLIAWTKFIGTVAPTILFGVIGYVNFNNEPNILILITGFFVAIYDVIYIIMLAKKKRVSKQLEN